jgi:uncharacterized protein
MDLIDDSVIRNEGGTLRLYGGRSNMTGKIIFPLPSGADRDRYAAVPLKSEGTLWSYTVQRFAPPSPPFAGPTSREDFKPYAVGYVELEGQTIVETRIVSRDFSRLKVGLPMCLTTTEFAPGRFTYAFTPSDEEPSP